jgi:hypothetical protein
MRNNGNVCFHKNNEEFVAMNTFRCYQRCDDVVVTKVSDTVYVSIISGWCDE